MLTRRGGPSGVPSGATGSVASCPSYTSAIVVPSGEITGPAPTRESMERCCTGVCHRSALPSTGIASSWLVPSRKRVEYFSSAAMSTCRPSPDQVGAPGPNICSCSFVTAPLCTFTMATLAARQMPSTSRYAMRVPSGDQAGPMADVGSRVSWRISRVCVS